MTDHNSQNCRPQISTIENGATLRIWYCLKAELLTACQDHNLSTAGSKSDLTDRLAHFLNTGERTRPHKQGVSSQFDWATEILPPITVITHSYANGTNTRAFFLTKIGTHFRFNIALMGWMKANVGKTLTDATQSWLDIDVRQKAWERSVIPASNQYNQYARDFADDNLGASRAQIRECWAAKRALPGHNRYERSDLRTLGNGCAAPHKAK